MACGRGKFNAPLAVDSYDAFIGLEVRAGCVLLSGHPHTLTLARDRLGSTEVGQDDMTVKPVFVDITSRSIETRTTS